MVNPCVLFLQAYIIKRFMTTKFDKKLKFFHKKFKYDVLNAGYDVGCLSEGQNIGIMNFKLPAKL